MEWKSPASFMIGMKHPESLYWNYFLMEKITYRIFIARTCKMNTIEYGTFKASFILRSLRPKTKSYCIGKIKKRPQTILQKRLGLKRRSLKVIARIRGFNVIN